MACDHIQRSIIFYRQYKLKRICSEKDETDVHVEDIKNWFCEIEYFHNLFREQVKEATELICSKNKSRCKKMTSYY